MADSKHSRTFVEILLTPYLAGNFNAIFKTPNPLHRQDDNYNSLWDKGVETKCSSKSLVTTNVHVTKKYFSASFSALNTFLKFNRSRPDTLENVAFVNKTVFPITIACLATWPLSGSEAVVDLVSIQTFLLFHM